MLLIFFYIQAILCCSNILKYIIFYCNIASLSRDILLKSTERADTNGQKRCNQGWNISHSFLSSSCWICSSLTNPGALCAVSKPLCLYICIFPAVSRKHFFLKYSLFNLLIFLCPLLHNETWASLLTMDMVYMFDGYLSF